MSGLLTVLVMLVAVLLILVVLIQDSKGGGLASNFSASNQVMGVQKTTELIEKITWGLIVALFTLSITLSFVVKSGSGTGKAKDTELRERINNIATPAPVKNAPVAPIEGQPAEGSANPTEAK